MPKTTKLRLDTFEGCIKLIEKLTKRAVKDGDTKLAKSCVRDAILAQKIFGKKPAGERVETNNTLVVMHDAKTEMVKRLLGAAMSRSPVPGGPPAKLPFSIEDQGADSDIEKELDIEKDLSIDEGPNTDN